MFVNIESKDFQMKEILVHLISDRLRQNTDRIRLQFQEALLYKKISCVMMRLEGRIFLALQSKNTSLMSLMAKVYLFV